MSQLTDACNIPYPSQYEDPWYNSMVSGFAAIDAIALAAREDRNLFIRCFGGVAVSAAGVVRWTADISIYNPRSGFVHTLAAGTATLTNGQKLYVVLPRGATASSALTAVVGASIPNLDTTVVLALRVDVGGSVMVMLRGGNTCAGGASCVPWLLPPSASAALMLVKSATLIESLDIVECDSTGGLIQSAAGSTNAIGVSYSTVTGDGSTVYAVVQITGIIEMYVENGQTVTAGVGVKVGGTANKIRSVGGGTFVGRLGIALKTVVGTGSNTCPVLLSPHGT